MTLGKRVAIGVAVGGLTVLIVHPRSRPLYQLYLKGYGYSSAVSQSPFLPENLGVLSLPKSDIEAGLWMQVGADRMIRGKPLTAIELRSLCVVADQFAESDPENAFWPQMGAVFQAERKKGQEATVRWIRASHRLNWHDYQSERLKQIASDMAWESGGPMAWHIARAIKLRSNYPGRVIESYARSVLSNASMSTDQGLAIRYATLRNGRLLRDGSGSLEVGELGVRTIEMSPLPGLVLRHFSPRRLELARAAFYNTLRAHGMNDEADFTNNTFRSNEAWLALTAREDPHEVFDELAATSVAVAVLPGAALILVAVGAALFGIGRLYQSVSFMQATLRAPYVQAIGLALAIASYGMTHMPLLALTLALSFSFASFTPERTRSKPPDYLGPFFRFTLIVLGAVFFALISIFVIGLTTPALEVFGASDVTMDYFGGQTLPLGLAGLVLALLLLVGPSWAMVLRIPTPIVLARAVRELGLTVLSLGLLGSVILAPAALWLDTRVGDTLQKLLTNEPNYYLQQ